jgi:hypothetical protein
MQCCRDMLRRKLEHVLILKDKIGLEDAGLFRKEVESISEKRLGRTVVNTGAQWAQWWDFIQVVLLLYICIAVPYQVSCSNETNTKRHHGCNHLCLVLVELRA